MYNVIGVGIFLFLVYCQDHPELNELKAGLIVVILLFIIGTIAKRI